MRKSKIINFHDTKLNDLSFHDKKLKTEEKLKPKTSRRKEIIKLRAEINKNENRKTIEKINKTKCCLFKKISKTDNLLAKLSNKDTTVNIRKE